MAPGDARSDRGLLTALAPAGFVLLWSTGFIGAKLGLPHAEPMTFLALRFAIAAAVLAPVAWMLGARWPRSAREVGALVVSGVLVQAIYLGGVFASIHHGVEAGVAALIVGAQPIATALLAGPLLGERVTARQWAGFALGAAGVGLVVMRKLDAGFGDAAGVAFCVAALLAIALGAIWRKRFGATGSLVTGSFVEFAAAGLVCAALALAFETRAVEVTGAFVFALAWLVGPLSLGAIPLLYALIRRGAASKVASLFFLVPPSTAAIAWFLFGERFGLWEVAGLGLTAVGVALVNLSPARRAS